MLRWVPVILALLLMMGTVSPIIHSGMRGDDSHVQVDFDGVRAADGATFTSYISDQIEHTLDIGRPQPLGVIEGLTYAAVFDERLPYKAGLAVLTFLSVVALLAFLRIFRVPRSTLLIVAVAFAMSLQFRHTHDPALGYYSTPQFTLLVLFGGLACYLRYLRGGSRWWFAATIALVAILLGTYEANHPLVLAFACLHLGRDPLRVRSWRWSVPIVAMGGFMTLLAAYMHGNATAPAGYETSLDLVSVILTAARQAISGLPDIYFLSGAQGLISEPTKAEVFGAFWRAGVAAALVILAFLMLRSQRLAVRTSPDQDPATGAIPIATIGVVLMAGSGLFISLATQHQQLITLGGGHLATLSGTVGFVMLAAAAWVQWGPALASNTAVMLLGAVCVFGMTMATQYTNLRIVAFERPGIEQRDLLKEGLDRNVLQDVAADATLYLNNRDLGNSFGNLVFYGGTADYLVLLRTGRKMDIRTYDPAVQDCGAPQPIFPGSDCATPSRRVAWLSVRASPGGGTVFVADGVPRGRLEQRGARRITALARGASAQGARPLLVGNKADGKPWSASDETWRHERLADGWHRYITTIPSGKGPMAPTINDPRSRIDFTKVVPPGEFVRLFGTKHVLP